MEIITPEFTRIASGLQGAEGPVFDKNGLMFVVAAEAMKDGEFAGEILKVDTENKTTSVVCKPRVDNYGGIPAGLQCDKDGNIMVADMRLGILKVTQSGEFTQISKTDDEGNIIQGCNDCCYDYDGNLWVTAPAGEMAPHEYTRSMEEPFGSLYCVQASDGKVRKVATDIKFPNGLAVTHTTDGKPDKLIVAETPTKLLLGYQIKYDQDNNVYLDNKSVWGKLPGTLEGGGDGLDFDEDDNLLVAHWGSGHIEVFAPSGGEPLKRIKCPFMKVSNIHFQPKTNIVYVTEHDNHALWRFTWNKIGKLQYCERS